VTVTDTSQLSPVAPTASSTGDSQIVARDTIHLQLLVLVCQPPLFLKGPLPSP
jgi:hypothetical protein